LRGPDNLLFHHGNSILIDCGSSNYLFDIIQACTLSYFNIKAVKAGTTRLRHCVRNLSKNSLQRIYVNKIPNKMPTIKISAKMPPLPQKRLSSRRTQTADSVLAKRSARESESRLSSSRLGMDSLSQEDLLVKAKKDYENREKVRMSPYSF
jgi:hypothetical protein